MQWIDSASTTVPLRDSGCRQYVPIWRMERNGPDERCIRVQLRGYVTPVFLAHGQKVKDENFMIRPHMAKLGHAG